VNNSAFFADKRNNLKSSFSTVSLNGKKAYSSVQIISSEFFTE